MFWEGKIFSTVRQRRLLLLFGGFFLFELTRLKTGDKICNYLVPIPFQSLFSHLECLMPDIQTGIVAVGFTQICHPAHQLFASLFITFAVSSSSFMIKSFRTPSLPPVTPQIIPLPVSVDGNIVCDVQGLSSTLNLIRTESRPWLKTSW